MPANLAKAMGVGVNIGNTFDVYDQPTDFDFLKGLVDEYEAKGFRHFRLPVTWLETGKRQLTTVKKVGDDWKIELNDDDKTLQNLMQILTYILRRKKLVVIINAHHEHWLKDHYTDKYSDVAKKFAALWRAITLKFAGQYSDSLFFELLNEPNNSFGNFGGGPSPTSPDMVNRTREIMKIGYEAVRKNDPSRVVLFTCNAQSAAATLEKCYPNAQALPNWPNFKSDTRLMAVVHTYDPWSFCGEDGSNKVFAGKIDELHAGIDRVQKIILDWSHRLEVPVSLNEYGVGRKVQAQRNNDVVREYYRYLTQASINNGFIPAVWSDGNWFAVTVDDKFVNGIADAILG